MRQRFAERGCLAVLMAYLIWLPMPFGSVVDVAQPVLILTPLAICAAATLLRARAESVSRPTASYRIWTAGAILFTVVVALQLVDLPDGLLRRISPQSFAIWSDASRVAALMLGGPARTAHPITIDPPATWLHLFRFVAYFATFQAAALLIRTNFRRVTLAACLGATALFETLYGVREAALQRFAIWGWRNTKIFGRVTGTYVNPNHFAHYAALILPLAAYLALLAWREAAPAGTPLRQRMVRLIERKFLLFAAGVIMALACIVAILVAQSRGALLALTLALCAAGALLLRPGRHRHANAVALAKLALAVTGFAIVVTALVFFLGTERTVRRFKPLPAEQTTLVGRRSTITAAIAIWRRFPLFGSGLGTFENAVSLVQSQDVHLIYNHAHDDYAEIAATTGTLGISIAMVSIVLGSTALVRLSRDRTASWPRRAFIAAALTSILVALVHALVDFNFFIPANPATLAAIAGAAVATRSARGVESDFESTGSRAAARRDADPAEG